MEVNLIRADSKDAAFIWNMQKEAFAELYKKYRDTETNPAAESIERVSNRLQQPFTHYYLIEYRGAIAGAIRIVDPKDGKQPKRISPMFILAAYRKRGLAQQAITEAERIHGNENWMLETILEETDLCRLYEKMGYRKTGKTEKLRENMTLAFYRK